MNEHNSLDNRDGPCSGCGCCGNFCPACGRPNREPYWVPYRPPQPWEYVPFQPAPITNPVWPDLGPMTFSTSNPSPSMVEAYYNK